MSENSTLHIHTQLLPETEPKEAEKASGRTGRTRRQRRRGSKAKLSAGDRLLRNSAIACAILLGVLALGNVRQPWAEKASESIERAMTMRINLDDPIGELTFVRQIMPESALVFLNVSGSAELSMPSDGAVRHAWSAVQPWMLFEEGDRPVYAADAGTVTAVSPLSGGGYGLLVDHGDGLESVYANLSETTVAAGDGVARGQQLGVSVEGLYFELRQGGEAVDPTERLGL